MKLEKRSMGEETTTPPQVLSGDKKNKPVIVYIMVLFIVAFLLMALSFAMHQRSNSEAIGHLQDSVNTLQEVQTAQDRNLKLEAELKAANGQIESLQNDVSARDDEIARLHEQISALESLYTLQQQYAAEDYDACRQTMQNMEASQLHTLLPSEGNSDVVSPAQRYQQLKEAVMSHST